MKVPHQLTYALSPLAVASIPVLSLYHTNSDILDHSLVRILPALGVALAVAAALYGIALLIIRISSAASVISSIIVALLFCYRGFHWVSEHVYEDPDRAANVARSLYTVLLLYSVAAIGIAAWRRSELRTTANILAAIVLSIFGVTVLQVAWLQLSLGTDSVQAVAMPTRAHQASHQPDIYYIVLDGYARADALRALCYADNGPFLQELKNRGFFIGEHSRTNYLQTVPSISSSLNYAYHSAQPEEVRPGVYRNRLSLSIKKSRAANFLRERGYSTVNIGSGHYLADPNPYADVQFPFQGVMATDFQTTLLSWTPTFEFFSPNALNQDEHHRARILHSLNSLPKAASLPGPKFVFSHIICPHPPYVFGEDGGNPRYDMPTIIDDMEVAKRELPRLKEMYVDQIQYLNKRLLEVVDEILSHYPPGDLPVIVIQADHGPATRYEAFVPEGLWLWERSGIFNAYLVPKDRKFALYSEITPVNTFRVIFNGLFDAQLPLLPDSTVFHRWEEPGVHFELTEAAIEAGAPPS